MELQLDDLLDSRERRKKATVTICVTINTVLTPSKAIKRLAKLKIKAHMIMPGPCVGTNSRGKYCYNNYSGMITWSDGRTIKVTEWQTDLIGPNNSTDRLVLFSYWHNPTDDCPFCCRNFSTFETPNNDAIFKSYTNLYLASLFTDYVKNGQFCILHILFVLFHTKKDNLSQQNFIVHVYPIHMFNGYISCGQYLVIRL